MPISTATINSGATVSASGGTALTFASRGSEPGRNVIYVASDTDLRTRREADFSVSYPKIQGSAPNGYTQARRTVVMKFPLVLENGNVTVNTIRIVLSTDVETTDAEIGEYLALGAQAMIDTDFSSYWSSLSVA